MSKRWPWQAAAAMLLVGCASLAYAATEIGWYVIGSGGGIAASTTASTVIRATLGQSVVGTASSANLTVSAGFWYGATSSPTDVGDDGPPGSDDPPGLESAPAVFMLFQNVPNPFNPRTTVAFSLAKPGHTTLRVFDLIGRLVTTLVDGELGAGGHRVEWDGRNAGGRQMASGIYFYELRSGGSGATGRMSLIK